MPKRRKTLKVPLPRFVSGRTQWRRRVHDAAAAAQRTSAVKYDEHDKLALDVRFGLPARKLKWVDVDNRLKHIMDALQGLLSGEGNKRRTKPIIIPNDNQVYRVTIEKRAQSTKRNASGGYVRIHRLT
jgi:Holliday junction resolvase RusA-like endonuclease